MTSSSNFESNDLEPENQRPRDWRRRRRSERTSSQIDVSQQSRPQASESEEELSQPLISLSDIATFPSEEPSRDHCGNKADRQDQEPVLKADRVGLCVNDLSQVMQCTRFAHRRGNTRLTEHPIDTVEEFSTGRVIGRLRRGKDIAMVVGSHF